MTTLEPNTTIYAGWDVEEAKKWVSDNGYNQTTVRMVRKGDQILIKTKGRLDL